MLKVLQSAQRGTRCKRVERERGMRAWKNIPLSSLWWKYAGWGCSRLCTSAEGISRLPKEDPERVHGPELSPEVSQIGCSQDDFGAHQYRDELIMRV